MPIKNDKYISLNTTIRTDLMRKVRILLTNPMTGRVAWGAMSGLITSLLKKWLDEQIKEEGEKENNGN